MIEFSDIQGVVIDLSLENELLYTGCEIKMVDGRLQLMTLPADASRILEENIRNIVDAEIAMTGKQGVVTLRGDMAPWAYLVAFKVVVRRFAIICYEDGKNGIFVITRK